MSRLKLNNHSTRRSGPRRSRLLTPRFLITLLALAGMGTSLLGPLGSSTAWAKEGSRFETMSTARSPYGVVASASEQASRVGIDVLNRGGNAVDAAVATIFAVGVTRPDFNSIGGGGFLIYRSRTGEVKALDFREYAPKAVTPTTFQGEGLHKHPLGGTGYLPIGVPGTVAGMAEAHRVLGSGKFTLADLIGSGAVPTDPPSKIRYAHELARDGIDVTFELAFFAFLFLNTRPYFPETMRIYGGLDALYFAKEKLKQEDYANSLKLIMEFGPEAFYQVKEYPPPPGGLLPRKSIAKLIVEDMETTGQAYGALMKEADLSEYQAKWRTPLVGSYRGHEIIAMPPPTSGGIATIEILNLLEGFPMSTDTHVIQGKLRDFRQSRADHLHVLAEAQKIAWADRDFFVGDPKFLDVPAAQLIEKSYADKRRKDIELDVAKPEYLHSSEPWATPWPRGASDSGMHTTHVSVIDRDGNAVSVTNSINSGFGSAVVARGTGFPLNDSLMDFNVDAPDTANAPGPRKRPRSSQSPTIVARDGKVFLVTGGTGGPYTPLGVVQNIVNMVDFRLNVAQAIDAERIDARAHGKECVEPDGTPSDVQGVPNCPKGWTNKLTIEHVAGAKQRFDNAVLDALIARGHALNPTGEYGGGLPLLEAVAWNPNTRLNEAASDPRHNRNFDSPPRDEERGAAGQPEVPDLRVTGIAASNNHAREGEKVTITATIANTGAADADPSKTEFLLDGATALGLVDTPALPAGGTADISVQWRTAGVKGEQTVRVTADSTNAVAESNETNNSATLNVNVKGNKITNGSFEQSDASGTGPAAWSGSNTGAGGTSWSDGGSDGLHSVSLSGNNGNALLFGSPNWTSDPVAVNPGEILSLTLSVQSVGASSPASASLVYLDSQGKVLGTIAALNVPLTISGFARLEQILTIPPGVAQVRVVLNGFAATSVPTAGTVTFDEVGLFEK